MQAADDSDFTDFVAGSSRRLLGLAILLTGDRAAAEDLLQGALERTYRHWSRINRDGAPDAYVRRVLVNAATDRWRRRRGVVTVDLDDVSVAEEDRSAELAARDELMRMVRELPAAQRRRPASSKSCMRRSRRFPPRCRRRRISPTARAEGCGRDGNG